MEMDFLGVLSEISCIPQRSLAESLHDPLFKHQPVCEYLAGNHILILPENEELFFDEVYGIYHQIQEDYFDKHGQLFIPSQHAIANRIDDINDKTIALFLSNSTEAMESVSTLYLSRITPTLPIHVEEALEKMELPYTKPSNNLNYMGEVISCNLKGFYDPYQLKMFEGDLYDRK